MTAIHGVSPFNGDATFLTGFVATAYTLWHAELLAGAVEAGDDQEAARLAKLLLSGEKGWPQPAAVARTTTIVTAAGLWEPLPPERQTAALESIEQFYPEMTEHVQAILLGWAEFAQPPRKEET